MPTQFIREMTLTRMFNAPRSLVFKLWTDPQHLANWWGPNGFSNPVCEIDVRPGGSIRICMHAPQLGFPNHWMYGTFKEISEPEKLVFISSAFTDENGNPGIEILNTITLDDVDGKTRLTVHAAVTKAAPGTEMALNGMDMGWSQSLERLAAVLAAQVAAV